MPDSSTSSQGAASGRCGGGRWWPSAGFAVPGSRCGRRAPVRRPRRSCRPATARPPGSFGHTYWLISGAPTPGYSRDLAITGPGRQAWRAGGVPLIIGKKILTASALRLLERLFGPVKPGPDLAAGMVSFDAPFVGDSADDVQAVVPGRVDHRLIPRTSVVSYFDPGIAAGSDDGLDGEGAAG